MALAMPRRGHDATLAVRAVRPTAGLLVSV
jgi:hypothetical protein